MKTLALAMILTLGVLAAPAAAEAQGSVPRGPHRTRAD